MAPDASPNAVRRSWPRRLLNRMEIGQAVFFAISLRVWQLFGGAATLLLMMSFFSPELQGYYYLFASLIALQAFFELGFNIVVINVSSHEWSKLQIDQHGFLSGDQNALSRLISLGRLLFRWYGIASGLFVGVVAVGGWLYLSRAPADGVQWELPWFTLVVASGLLLWTLPFLALLEGCNQVETVNKFRLIQAILASLSVWIVMVLGGGLWAAVAATTARLACDLVLLLIVYRRFFTPFFTSPHGRVMDWRTEIWPMQWRLALGAVFAYFSFSLFTLVMWEYHGKVVAGQMGMTWTVVTAVQAAALAWVQTRVPLFGMLISDRQFSELDRVFFRVATLGAMAFTVAATMFVGVIWWIHQANWKGADRLLGPEATLVFLLAAFVQMLVSSLCFYVRAHKTEPFLRINVIANCAVGISVWLLGWKFGPIGAASGLLGVHLFLNLPVHWLIWRRCRATR